VWVELLWFYFCRGLVASRFGPVASRLLGPVPVASRPNLVARYPGLVAGRPDLVASRPSPVASRLGLVAIRLSPVAGRPVPSGLLVQGWLGLAKAMALAVVSRIASLVGTSIG
jgi:hypothetical protein